MKKLEEYIRSIPDFPEKGIIFRDVTSVLEDAEGFKLAIDTMQDLVKDLDIDAIVGAESRGFIFGAPIAYNLNKPFCLIKCIMNITVCSHICFTKNKFCSGFSC